MKYFKVTCRHGHTGKSTASYITFYIKANNLIEAMDKAKKMPSVHHNKPPINAIEISSAEYMQQRKSNRNAYKEAGMKKEIF